MTRLLALIATVPLTLAIIACGSTGTPMNAYVRHATQHDRDDDDDNNDDDNKVLDFGHPADTADRRAIAAVLERYYALAATNDGAHACAMLDPLASESVVSDYGHTAYLSGANCATVLTKLFRRAHESLTKRHATLKLYAIRVDGNRMLAVLTFASVPAVRQMAARRIAGVWRIGSIFDGVIE